jgi:hypothetical protein
MGISCEIEQGPIVIYDDNDNNNTKNNDINVDIDGEYTFIEIQIHSYAQKLESGKRARSALYGGKSYNFDNSSYRLQLRNLSNEERNSLKTSNLICGTEYTLPWEFGDGTFGRSKVISAFPESIGYFALKTLNTDNISINNLANDGSIKLTFRERNFIINKNENRDFIDEYNTENDFGKFFIRDTVRIFNHGKQNKNKITLVYNNPC